MTDRWEWMRERQGQKERQGLRGLGGKRTDSSGGGDVEDGREKRRTRRNDRGRRKRGEKEKYETVRLEKRRVAKRG